ncbi:MAG TPA: hypothetical protein VHX39_01740 [Acetobacteraceae bacterium]|nr:hypothetical protein [Acetobacteraceae bacterium]
MPLWRPEDILFQLDDEMTSDPVVTIVAVTPAGNFVIMTEPTAIGSKLVLHRTHVQGARPNVVGAANLKILAQALLERFGYDEAIVEGAARTTGSRPGSRPRDLRFRRRAPS